MLEKAILGAEGNRGDVRHLVRLTWLTPQVGLAFPYDTSFAMRTTDAGATWAKVAAGINGYVYAVEVVGHHVWFCDSSGKLKTSADLGVRWSDNQKLFEESDVNPTNWCSSISFLDRTHGWALGWKSLWQTQDGGATWQALTPPKTKADRLEVLTRMSPSVAWVGGSSPQS